MEKCRILLAPRDRFNRVILVILSVVLCAVYTSHALATGALELTLKSEKNTYVLREPVKFTAKLANVSGNEVRIIGVGNLSTNMEYLHYEIEYPSGRTDHRRFRYMEVTMIPNPDYVGEPLPPGECVYIVLYPNISEVIRSSSSVEESELETFNEVGTYRVRLIYAVPRVYDNLSPNRYVESNQIEVSFRSADRTESEILDACWVDGGGWFSVGEGCPGPFPEEYEHVLRNAIEKYPNHPMNYYTRLLLASALVSYTPKEHERRIEEGLEVLRELDRLVEPKNGVGAAQFRNTERAMLRGYGLSSLGKKKAAMDVYENILQTIPELRTNSYFMSGFLVCQYDDPGVVSKWWLNRKMGVLDPDQNIDNANK